MIISQTEKNLQKSKMFDHVVLIEDKILKCDESTAYWYYHGFKKDLF